MSTLNNRKLLRESAEEERGSIETMKKLSDWVADANQKLRAQLDARDVRMARLHIGEMAGTIEQLATHAELLAKDIGLPDLKI